MVTATARRATVPTDLPAALEPHRRALRFHCYQLLGALTDADDLVQETFTRALTAGERFEGRAELKTWLFRIATFACIDELRRRKRRQLVSLSEPNGDEAAILDAERWVQPFPDAMVPSQRYDRAEAVTLAFVAALQWLAPRQRAVLVLRDSLDWSAEEVATLLGMTVAAVHTSLLRARAKLATRPLDRARSSDDLTAARSFAAAFQRRDVAALSAMLRRDVELHMPPFAMWLQGPAAVLELVPRRVWAGRDLRLRLTRANRRLAVTMTDRAAGDTPYAVAVFDQLTAGRVARIHAYLMPALVPFFTRS